MEKIMKKAEIKRISEKLISNCESDPLVRSPDRTSARNEFVNSGDRIQTCEL